MASGDYFSAERQGCFTTVKRIDGCGKYGRIQGFSAPVFRIFTMESGLVQLPGLPAAVGYLNKTAVVTLHFCKIEEFNPNLSLTRLEPGKSTTPI